MTIIDTALHDSLRALKLSGMLHTLDARWTVPDLVDSDHSGHGSTRSRSGWEAPVGSSPPSTRPRRYSL
jgi:hypothetical protein